MGRLGRAAGGRAARAFGLFGRDAAAVGHGDGACLARFAGDAAITFIAVARDDLFVAGSANGAIHILDLRGPTSSPTAKPHPRLQASAFGRLE